MLSSGKLFAQSVLYEQKSINYFFDTIFKEKYRNEKVIEFSGYAGGALSDFKLFENCFKKKDSIHLKLREMSFGKVFKKKAISLSKINGVSCRKVKIKSAKRLKMWVWLANEVNGKFYVLIEIIKQYRYTDAYMFELEKDGKILRWCATGMMH